VKFPRKKFLHLKGFRVGFTHFTTLFYQPDAADLEYMYNRFAAGTMKLNAEGGDLLLPMMWKKEWEDDEEGGSDKGWVQQSDDNMSNDTISPRHLRTWGKNDKEVDENWDKLMQKLGVIVVQVLCHSCSHCLY
jgi:hypothetical protein